MLARLPEVNTASRVGFSDPGETLRPRDPLPRPQEVVCWSRLGMAFISWIRRQRVPWIRPMFPENTNNVT